LSEQLKVSGSITVTDENGLSSQYNASRIEFKQPSEHTFQQKHCDMEMQIIHEAADKQCIISLFFNVGKYPSQFLNKLRLQKLDGAEKVDINELISKVDICNMCSYDGSITVPPCTRNVRWIILSSAMAMSSKQLEQIQKYLIANKQCPNNRATHEIGQRVIYRKQLKAIKVIKKPEFILDCCRPEKKIPDIFKKGMETGRNIDKKVHVLSE
jgi:carbonic anhydrase